MIFCVYVTEGYCNSYHKTLLISWNMFTVLLPCKIFYAGLVLIFILMLDIILSTESGIFLLEIYLLK